MVRIRFPPAKSRANDRHRCDLVPNSCIGQPSVARELLPGNQHAVGI